MPRRFLLSLSPRAGLFCCLLAAGCVPRLPVPLTDAVARTWKAQTVRANGALVFSLSAPNNLRPDYAKLRLTLDPSGRATFTDLDGRPTLGTWTLSTDNQRLILRDLTPIPTDTDGNIEFYLTAPLQPDQLNLRRTNQSRKTGNAVNEYALIPA